jgi:hypothetical protein
MFRKIQNRFRIEAHQIVMNAAELLPFCKFACILFAVSKWARRHSTSAGISAVSPGLWKQDAGRHG